MMAEQLPILNKLTLAEKVELLVQKEGIRYSEAVIHICDDYGIEPTDIAQLIIDSPLEQKIADQAIKLNVLKGKKRQTNTLSYE